MFPPIARPLKCLVPRFSAAQTMLAHPHLGLRVRPCHTPADTTTPPTFASLVRNCKFTMMGDPVGKEVVGRIYHVVEEDLYIDFGYKFGCVCRVPREGSRGFTRLRLSEFVQISEFFQFYITDIVRHLSHFPKVSI